MCWSDFIDFLQWKSKEEEESLSRYVSKKTLTNKSGQTTQKFLCHRSGYYKPQGTDRRHLKVQGTCKINAVCTARIIAKTNSQGSSCSHFFVLKMRIKDVNFMYCITIFLRNILILQLLCLIFSLYVLLLHQCSVLTLFI